MPCLLRGKGRVHRGVPRGHPGLGAGILRLTQTEGPISRLQNICNANLDPEGASYNMRPISTLVTPVGGGGGGGDGGGDMTAASCVVVSCPEYTRTSERSGGRWARGNVS